MRLWPHARRGAVAIMTALLAVPLVAMMGLAIDLSRVWLVKSRLQMSLDAGVLVAARDISGLGTDADGKAMFWANFNRTSIATGAGYLGAIATNPVVHNPAPGDVSGSVQMTSTATVVPTLLGVLNIGVVTVGAASTAKTAATGLELALVLDNTGSMDTTNTNSDSSAIGALRTAAQTLVGILYGSADTQPHLWVSVVPFAAAVNIGNTHTGWLASDSSTHPKESDFAPSTWMGCVMARTGNTGATNLDDSNDTPPSAGHYFWRFLYPSTYHMYPTAAGIQYTTGTGTNKQTLTYWYPGDNEWQPSTWTAAGNEPDRSNAAVGPNLDCPSLPILPETASKSTVLTWLDRNHMIAIDRGGTFINLGLQAGWWTLSPNWQGLWGTPADQQLGTLPLAYNTPYMKKAIVLMTDGTNNWNDWNCGVPGQVPPQVTVPPSTTCPWTTKPPTVVPPIPAWPDAKHDAKDTDFAAYGRLESNIGGLPTTNPQATLDGLTSTMCATIKGRGIIIYTIRFDSSGKAPKDPNDATTTMLKNCASSTSDYFYSPNATQLQTAFTQIGQELSSLRISQ
jgi:Flp pilus assembly protein TadG